MGLAHDDVGGRCVSLRLEDLLDRLTQTPDKSREEIERLALEATAHMRWVPNPGPQSDAYFSEADELFFGGQAGGGKSDLEIGLAINAHDRSLLLRRTNPEADGLVERMAEIMGNRDGFNSQKGVWTLPDKRLVRIGGCQLEEDKQKYKGKPNSLICFDEVSDFTETQYVFISGWNRSTNPKQRCRIVAAGNPPTRPEGFWVVKRWAAWLDPKHHNPALPGELRWYTTDEDGDEIEVDGRGPHQIGKRLVLARSRTFIPSALTDNPDLASTNYSAVLDALPIELRTAYRDGNFAAGLKDAPMQCIPTEWIKQAQDRWTKNPPYRVPMCAIGVDVAQGGQDKTVAAVRHDGWYAPLIVKPGAETPDGASVAGEVIRIRRDGAAVVIDLGGGWGSDAYAHLHKNGIDAKGYMGLKKSTRRTANRLHGFFNVRSDAYWSFREALDPSQPQGSTIMLPPDPELVSDLAALSYCLNRQNQIQVESKEDVVNRLGRSTDRGDAVVMAWYAGVKIGNIPEGDWEKAQHKQRPVVISGRAAMRKRQ